MEASVKAIRSGSAVLRNAVSSCAKREPFRRGLNDARRCTIALGRQDVEAAERDRHAGRPRRLATKAAAAATFRATAVKCGSGPRSHEEHAARLEAGRPGEHLLQRLPRQLAVRGGSRPLPADGGVEARHVPGIVVLEHGNREQVSGTRASGLKRTGMGNARKPDIQALSCMAPLDRSGTRVHCRSPSAPLECGVAPPNHAYQGRSRMQSALTSRRVSRRCKTFVVASAVLASLAWTSMAAAPGDDKDKKAKGPSVNLKPNPPMSFSPARATVTAELRGGADTDEELYCPGLEWDWGDGTIPRRPRRTASPSRPARAP